MAALPKMKKDETKKAYVVRVVKSRKTSPNLESIADAAGCSKRVVSSYLSMARREGELPKLTA